MISKLYINEQITVTLCLVTITKKPNLLLMLMSRCVNAIFVRFQFEYTVESKQCSVIFIRSLLNVIYLLALCSLGLPSLKPADNQEL